MKRFLLILLPLALILGYSLFGPLGRVNSIALYTGPAGAEPHLEFEFKGPSSFVEGSHKPFNEPDPSKAPLKKSSFEEKTAIDESLAKFLRSLEGRFLWGLSLKKIADRVAAFYPGAQVHVLRRLPGQALIFVQEPEKAFLLLKEGDFYLVSQKGEIGPLKRPAEPLDWPILRGQALASQRELRHKAFLALVSFPEGGSLLSKERVSEIFYRPSRRAFVFYVSGFALEFKGPLSEKEIQRINFVLNYLLQKGRHRAFVDARQTDKIIVKSQALERERPL